MARKKADPSSKSPSKSTSKSRQITTLKPRGTISDPTSGVAPDPGLVRPGTVQGTTQVDKVMRMLTDSKVALFHSPEGKAYAALQVNGVLDTHDLKSASFIAHMQHLYFESERRPLPKNVLTEILEVLEGRALYRGEPIPVFTRVGADLEGNLYLDLADPDRTIVQITPQGWEIANKPPVRFRRIPGELSLPRPVSGPIQPAIDAFRGLLNVGGDEDLADLVLAWVLGTFWPTGPYPILAVTGEPDSAKSTTSHMLKSLIDPASPAFKPVPKSDFDMALTAERTWIFATDNVRVIPEWMADSLCKVSTGAGGAARKHYSQQDETLLTVMRPIILNGTYTANLREDLLSRALLLSLPPITSAAHMPLDEYWLTFRKAHPAILGMLCTAVAASLAGTKKPASLPRMADWAIRVSRAEEALEWPDGWFCVLLDRVKADKRVETRYENPLVDVLLNDAYFTNWKGTVSELGETISKRAKPLFRRTNDHWLGNVTALGLRLRGARESLLEGGLRLEYCKKRGSRSLYLRPVHPN